MKAIWGWLFVVLFLLQLIIAVPADDSLTISPDVLNKDMPVVIKYTGFSDGESIIADFDLSFMTESDKASGITEGFLLYPYTTDDGKITGFSGNLAVNGER